MVWFCMCNDIQVLVVCAQFGVIRLVLLLSRNANVVLYREHKTFVKSTLVRGMAMFATW